MHAKTLLTLALALGLAGQAQAQSTTDLCATADDAKEGAATDSTVIVGADTAAATTDPWADTPATTTGGE